MNEIEFREISFGSSDYEAELKLRYEILRRPLGLQFSAADLAKENEAVHLGAFSDGELIGCLYLVKADDQTVRMRQVAIASSHQGQGVGRALVNHAETVARSHGFSKMILTARLTALPFYSALGYLTCSDVTIELTIPHQKMEKILSP